MKRILKSLSILFIALVMVSCSNEAQSITSGSGSGGTQGPSDPSGGTQGPSGPSDPSGGSQYPSGDSFENVIDPDREVEVKELDEIPPESDLYDANEGNGYTTYEKVKGEDPSSEEEPYENMYYEDPYIPWNLTVGKDQIKISIDRDALGEIISGVEGVKLFPRGIDIPEVLEINLLNSESIQKFLDFFCLAEYLAYNNPLALYPSETKTIEIESVSGLDSIKDNPEVSVKWYVKGNERMPGNGELTNSNGTISSITLKEVPITASHLYIEVVAKEGDSSEEKRYMADIKDLYHPTNKDGKVYADATVKNADFFQFDEESYFGNKEPWEKMQLVSLDGKYVTDQADSPYYEMTLGYLLKRKSYNDDEPFESTSEDTTKLTLKRDATSGNLILNDSYNSVDSKIAEYTKKKE